MPISPDIPRTANKLVAPKKGIWAADESNQSLLKRFNTLNISSTPETRRDWREMMCSTPNISASISGIILFTETLEQKTRDGRPFSTLLNDTNIIPGVKVDLGLEDIPT